VRAAAPPAARALPHTTARAAGRASARAAARPCTAPAITASPPLGRNTALEAFPVGRRVAFDAPGGRLWAVCLECGRWNLAPVEERWAALEACERLFRGAARRYGTANVALAQLAGGAELVRVGAAPGPELAAWRYGGRLLRARHGGERALVRAATAYAAFGDRVRRWATGSLGAGTPEERGLRLVLAAPGGRAERVVAVARDARAPGGATGAGAPIIRRRHLAGAALVRPDAGEPWALEVPHEHGLVRLSGAAGLRTAATLLAAVNAHGVTPEAVDAALRKVDEAVDPDGYFNRVLRAAWRWQWGRAAAGSAPGAPAAAAAAVGAGAEAGVGAAAFAPGGDLAARLAVSLTGRAFWGRGGLGSADRLLLLRTPLVDRLALEMAAHEDAERRALAGTLAALEAAWREAEELARIVDAL
jgi:hypothetical protein